MSSDDIERELARQERRVDELRAFKVDLDQLSRSERVTIWLLVERSLQEQRGEQKRLVN